MGEIPPEARLDPVKWAGDHIAEAAPEAAQRMKYTMMFGSDALAYQASKDILAIKGLTTKPRDVGMAPPAMVFQFLGSTTPTGVPILPYSNAAPALPPGADVVTINAQSDDDSSDSEDDDAT